MSDTKRSDDLKIDEIEKDTTATGTVAVDAHWDPAFVKKTMYAFSSLWL